MLAVGAINSGETEIYADVKALGADVPVTVTLSADYAMFNPSGFPSRPSFTGAAIPQFPHTISSGTTLALLRCEAVALVDAGAASFA